MSEPLYGRVADLAVRYLMDPPRGDDRVVEFTSPDELVAAFETTVGLALGADEPAHDADAMVAAAEQVVRYSMHTGHPRFLNQNFAGSDPVAVVGDWLTSVLNSTTTTFEVAPVFTLMETALLDKLASVAGYPVDTSQGAPPPGLFCPGGSTGTLYALQLARHRHQPDVIVRGAGPDRLVLFVSASGHYSARKSAALLGLGTDAVVEVATTPDGAMVPSALGEAIADARGRGLTPFAVIATAGTTVTAAFDPIDAIADICGADDIWLHVDGCYGGSALFSGPRRFLLAGVERSDSFVWDLHKMMGMTQQCTALLVREPERLRSCFSIGADYLFQPDKQFADHDLGDRTFQCGRRVDALKLWLAWKSHGDEGFAARIEHAVAMADHARSVIDASDGVFSALVHTGFTNAVFAWVPPEHRPLDLAALDAGARDRLHRLAPRIKSRMQQEGTAMVGYQPVHGINTFRLLFMNPEVTTGDVDAVLGHLARYGAEEWAELE
jgi:glutamate/tyrosine decarboxylase-like PLP-dependent enzyme